MTDTERQHVSGPDESLRSDPDCLACVLILFSARSMSCHVQSHAIHDLQINIAVSMTVYYLLSRLLKSVAIAINSQT